MDRQASMLAEFLAMAFGGPHAYSGRDLRTAHAQLPGLTDMHFDLVVGYLADTLANSGSPMGTSPPRAPWPKPSGTTC